MHFEVTPRHHNLYRGAFTAMANPCELLIETNDAALAAKLTETAANEAIRIEQKFSRYRTDSIVHAINTADGRSIRLDDETGHLIDYAATLWELTEGAFDITSGILRHAWKFSEPQIKPTAAAIASLMQRVGWQRVQWNKPVLRMPAGMELDFGGIGKEYAVDRTVALIEALSKAPVLVNFGGDLRTAGARPVAGSWQVGIESVTTQGQASNLVKLATGALATSGDTRRFVEIDGVRYGHIIDARTGWPSRHAARSVTVAADTCSQAGTFTTLAILQGADAENFLQEQGLRYWILR